MIKLTTSGSRTGDSFYEKSQNGSDDPLNHAAWNPYSSSIEEIYQPAVIGAKGYYRRAGENGWWFVWPSDSQLLPQSEEYRFLQEIVDKVQGVTWSGGVFAAEAKESMGMILGIAKGLADGYRAMRKGDLRKMVKAFGSHGSKVREVAVATGNLRMGYRYGVNPMLSDAASAAEALAEQLNKVYFQRYTFSTRSKWVEYKNYSAAGKIWSYRFKKSRRVLALIEEQDPPSIPYRLGLTDPASIAWEIVPLSFVADWFIPIGDYLQLRSAVPRIKGRFLIQDMRVNECTYIRPAGYPSVSMNYTGLPGSYIRLRNFSRSISTTLTVPYPEIKDFWKETLTVNRVIDSISILSGLLKRK